jgi:ribose transport system substrate-binding protein
MQVGVTIASAAILMLATACSSSSSDSGKSNGGSASVPAAGGSSAAAGGSTPGTVDVGNGKTITVKKPVNIGIYTSSGSASFGQVEDAVLEKEAKAAGFNITFFDSQFNSALQLKQLQSAVQTKKFNVLGVLPVDGQVICKVLSQDAPAAGLLVLDFDQPLCGKFTEEGENLWQPGTLSYISGYNTKDTLRQWIEAIATANSGSAEVAVVEGVASDGLSTNTNLLVKEAEQKHAGFKVVSTVNTDYSTEQGYQKTQALLQAHPNVKVILCTQSNLTQGVARAVKQAGKTKSVFVADYGGSKDVVALMKEGQVQLTGPTFPASEGKIVIQRLKDVMAGTKVPRFESVPFKVITQDNLSSYTPEY